MSRDLNDLEPVTRERCVKFLQECAKYGTPVIVTQTFRSFEEQEALYAKGRALPGPVVTNARAGDSFHNYRRAFDVVFSRGTGISYFGPWDEIGPIGEKLGLEWGGRFKTFPDKPHFQNGDIPLNVLRSRSLVLKADTPTDKVGNG